TPPSGPSSRGVTTACGAASTTGAPTTPRSSGGTRRPRAPTRPASSATACTGTPWVASGTRRATSPRPPTKPVSSTTASRSPSTIRPLRRTSSTTHLRSSWMIERAGKFDGEFDAVLTAAHQGAPWAFERIFTVLGPIVHGYLRMQGAHEPEDLTSEVFVA